MDSADALGSGYDELRSVAFAIAYRMLGSVSEAEDIVQEGLLRLVRAQSSGAPIESPRAYLTTIVSRLSIDHLRSARVRRETYVGEWLPEPLLTGGEDDPAWQAELSDSLSLAFIVLLESLSPEQRAAFLLRDVFDEPYARIAQIVGTSEQNARQLVTRARRHVDAGRPRFDVLPGQRDELAARFLGAAQDGDLDSLEQLLADDVVLHGDGGGKAPAARRPVRGRTKVARALVGGLRAGARAGLSLRPTPVNHQPGAVLLDPEGKLAGVMVLDIVDGRVQAVSAVANPDKLRHLGPLADLRGLRSP